MYLWSNQLSRSERPSGCSQDAPPPPVRPYWGLRRSLGMRLADRKQVNVWPHTNTQGHTHKPDFFQQGGQNGLFGGQVRIRVQSMRGPGACSTGKFWPFIRSNLVESGIETLQALCLTDTIQVITCNFPHFHSFPTCRNCHQSKIRTDLGMKLHTQWPPHLC